MQTLVQSCTTTKVDTYFGTEAAKEKNDPCSPYPYPLNRKPQPGFNLQAQASHAEG